MPAGYRGFILFNFTKTPTCGFSETYDFAGTLTESEAKARLQNIVNARKGVLSQDWVIVSVKLASVGIKAKSGGGYFLNLTKINLCPDIDRGFGALGDSDLPGAAVFSQWNYTDVPRAGNRQFRGIPDVYWEGDQLTNIAIGAISGFGAFARLQGVGKIVLNKTAGTSQFKPLLCIKVRRISIRRVGRPFGLLRGRRWSRRESTG